MYFLVIDLLVNSTTVWNKIFVNITNINAYRYVRIQRDGRSAETAPLRTAGSWRGRSTERLKVSQL